MDALPLIQVDATPLPFVVDEAFAISPDSPQVIADYPNVGEPRVLEEGNVEEAFLAADSIVEGIFAAPVQIHHALETHGVTAHADDGTLTVWASTQGISSVRDGLADNLEIPQVPHPMKLKASSLAAIAKPWKSVPRFFV